MERKEENVRTERQRAREVLAVQNAPTSRLHGCLISVFH